MSKDKKYKVNINHLVGKLQVVIIPTSQQIEQMLKGNENQIADTVEHTVLKAIIKAIDKINLQEINKQDAIQPYHSCPYLQDKAVSERLSHIWLQILKDNADSHVSNQNSG